MMNNNEIRAVYSHETIRVYQAYSSDIADEAVMQGTFGSKFKMDRMTKFATCIIQTYRIYDCQYII